MGDDLELPAGFADLRGQEFQGRYEIDELLYASPRRVAYGGREQEARRGIVLEVVRPSSLNDQATLERFERRIAACRRVRHDVIHDPIDAGELTDGKLYVVSYRPFGEPLDRHLQRHPSGRLGWLEARPLLVELVSGLVAAHSRRVVHGSLSPSCCWVNRPDFGKPSLRVLGFGLNANPSSDDANATRSRTNVLSVDAVFMAPETAGAVFGDERSDVYMAGLVTWFMLVGRPPFQGANPFQLATMHLTAPVPAMHEDGAEVPAHVEALVGAMLAKEPQQRPTMAEVESVISGFEEGGEFDVERSPVEPDTARGRRGRARARQAGASSRDEAVQRLTEKGGSASRPFGMARLPGQEIVDARRAVEPRRASAPPRQVVMSPAPSPFEHVVHDHSPMPEAFADPSSESSLSFDSDHAAVDATQHLDGFTPLAVAPPQEEHTMLLAATDLAPPSSSPERDIEGTMVLQQLYESSHEGAVVLPTHEYDREGTVMLPAVEAKPGTVPFTAEQIRALRASARVEVAPAVVPVVTGGTQRMSPEEIRALRMGALAGQSPAAPPTQAPPAADVEGTQILAVEGHDATEPEEIVDLELDVEPDEEPDAGSELDLEEQSTNALSPAQIAALRRQYGTQGRGKGGR